MDISVIYGDLPKAPSYSTLALITPVNGERLPWHLLNVIYAKGTPTVITRNNKTMDLFVRPDSDTADRAHVLTPWYHQRLKEEIAPLITKWEPIIGVQVAQWGVKQMKTRWGTCTIEARRIWLNLELIKKPTHCLEYIVVHELVHLLERHHNERFREYMSRYLPYGASIVMS